MEKTPSLENKIEKQRVLEALRAKGLEDPETKALVIKWTEEQEEIVARENTPRATIVFNIERADLYLAAGDVEGELECLEDALYQAEQEGETELALQIAKKIEEIQ